ncbi:MAG: 50S ribosomal protein L32, partial [Candidatus Veblenbacteria bacterium]|nr:50S ribosomal protein L32 [Candidatus Veblenbacteria bacterium]
MGLPGHRRTSSDKRRRASHFALKPSSFTVCSHCKQAVLPHQVCRNCGYYRGRQVLKLKSRLVGRAKARAAAEAEKKAE